MKTTSSERRLHPVSVIFEVGSKLGSALLPLILILFATRAQGNTGMLLLVGVAGLGGLVLILSVVRYLRFSYRYDETGLVIRSGLLTRNVRTIPYARIQNLDAVQNPLHRAFDVAVVHIQTGGGLEPEASLRVLPAVALNEMRMRILAAGGATTSLETDASHATIRSTPADPTRTLLRLGPRDLVLAGFIENRGMVLIAGALALLEQAGASGRLIERLSETDDAAVAGLAERWVGVADLPVALGALYITGALLVVLLFIRLLSTLWAVVRLYDFRLQRVGDELHTEYGLFTRVSATIPLRRVQTVIVRDGVLHRLFGRHAMVVETAGGPALETGARAREPIAPILRTEQLRGLIRELQPGLEPDAVDWQPVHPRAFGRMLRGSLFWPVVLSIAAVFLVQEWAIAVLVLLLARALLRARLRARYLAWSITSDSILVRDGALTRATRIARFNRVQVASLDRNPFDLRTGMAGVRADTAGARGGIVVPYLPEHTAAALHGELTARTAATAFTW